METVGQSVYVMTTPSGYTKIGIAKDPADRKSVLQTGCPEPIEIVGATTIADGGVCPRKMERGLHEILKPYHSHGEWFVVPHEKLHSAWKLVWTELKRPEAVYRWRRFVLRFPLPPDVMTEPEKIRVIAERIRRATTNPDVLALCDAILGIKDSHCPVCAARRSAKAASQRKWREKHG